MLGYTKFVLRILRMETCLWNIRVTCHPKILRPHYQETSLVFYLFNILRLYCWSEQGMHPCPVRKQKDPAMSLTPPPFAWRSRTAFSDLISLHLGGPNSRMILKRRNIWGNLPLLLNCAVHRAMPVRSPSRCGPINAPWLLSEGSGKEGAATKSAATNLRVGFGLQAVVKTYA